MLNAIGQLSLRRTPWALLAVSALVLELAALYFQYVEQLDPCVLCIYERVAVLGVLLAGLITLLSPHRPLLRWLGMALWGVSAGWGFWLALEHVGIQFSSTMDFSCNFFAEFPAWAKLDQWLPAIFMPTGTCDEVQWLFASLSMPQWMLVIFGAYLLTLGAVIAGQPRLGHQPGQ